MLQRRITVAVGTLTALVALAAIALYIAGGARQKAVGTPAQNASKSPATPPALLSASPTSTTLTQVQEMVESSPSGTLAAVPIPVSLQDSFVPGATSGPFSYFGLAFDAPWPGPAVVATNTESVDLSFAQDRSLTLIDVPLNVVGGLFDEMKSLEAESSSISSIFDLEQASLDTTPSNLTAATPPQEAQLVLTLLKLKESFEQPGFALPLYQLSGGVAYGFQLGTAGTPEPVRLDLYDSTGDVYELQVVGTQDEINWILSSMRPSY